MDRKGTAIFWRAALCLGLCGCVVAAGADDSAGGGGDPAGADRLEVRGAELWRQGEVDGASKMFDAAIAIDPLSPERPFRFAERLAALGSDAIQAGEVDRATWAFSEAEQRLVAAATAGQGRPEHRELTARAYRMLSEIASSVRQDYPKAEAYLAESVRVENSPFIEPESPPTSEAKSDEPGPAPSIAIGVAKSVQLGGHRLRLAFEGDRKNVTVKEFVPLGETVESWSALFAQREH
ncbi:MAG: hypothetical protein KDL87_15900, partial [Verrucomicrobiae bacterium]|nr:hypothetical protein [Verrucomicrobiae bacterium]